MCEVLSQDKISTRTNGEPEETLNILTEDFTEAEKILQP